MTGMMRIDDRKGNSMIFIGITGGVGAGKSAVLGYLKELDGVRVMLSDEIAHELMEPGSDCYNRLKELFAEEPIWLEDGHFDGSPNTASPTAHGNATTMIKRVERLICPLTASISSL